MQCYVPIVSSPEAATIGPTGKPSSMCAVKAGISLGSMDRGDNAVVVEQTMATAIVMACR
jgi:hypothetical protein